MKKSKSNQSIQDLNLLDSYLFGEVTEIPENAEYIAKIIIERTLGCKIKKISVMPEKQLAGVDTSRHGIRMDLCIMEYEEDNVAGVYDIEPNRYKIKELPRRSRYSQALTDAKLLSAGKRYRDLPDYVSIWILSEDPFGLNRAVYTVRSKVEEVPDANFDDGVTKVFLYAYGEEGGSEALRSLLRYFVDSDASNATDKELKEVHKIVTGIRSDAMKGEKYMTLHDMIEFEKEESFDEGYEEGVSVGEARGIAQGIETGIAQGIETGIMQSVVIYIDSLREFHIQEEDILDSVMRKFDIPKEKVMEMMACSL